MKTRNKDSKYLIANKNGKWGLIDYKDGSIVVPFEYDKLDEVPIDIQE